MEKSKRSVYLNTKNGAIIIDDYIENTIIFYAMSKGGHCNVCMTIDELRELRDLIEKFLGNAN